MPIKSVSQLKKLHKDELKDVMRKWNIKGLSGNKDALVNAIRSDTRWKEIRETITIPEREPKKFTKRQLEAQERFRQARKKDKMRSPPPPRREPTPPLPPVIVSPPVSPPPRRRKPKKESTPPLPSGLDRRNADPDFDFLEDYVIDDDDAKLEEISDRQLDIEETPMGDDVLPGIDDIFNQMDHDLEQLIETDPDDSDYDPRADREDPDDDLEMIALYDTEDEFFDEDEIIADSKMHREYKKNVHKEARKAAQDIKKGKIDPEKDIDIIKSHKMSTTDLMKRHDMAFITMLGFGDVKIGGKKLGDPKARGQPDWTPTEKAVIRIAKVANPINILSREHPLAKASRFFGGLL